MDDSGHGMSEVLVLYGVVGNMQTNSLTVNRWDEAVLALPVIAQLLLAAVLAVDGYRRYLRAGSLRRAPENGADSRRSWLNGSRSPRRRFPGREDSTGRSRRAVSETP